MRKRNLLSLVLTLMVMLSSFTAITFADNSKEQLSIDFTTDKKEYKQGEDLNIEIKIKNTSGKDLKEIEVKNILPKGIELKSSEGGEKIDNSTVKWNLDNLKNNESVNFKLSSNFYKYQTLVPVPDTGMDYFSYLLAGSILLVISISGIIYIRKNQIKFDKKKATSIGMALVMVCGSLGKSLIIADASQNENNLIMNKTLKLKCDGENLYNIVEVKGIFVDDIEVDKPIKPETPEKPVNPNDNLLDQNNPKWFIDSDNDGLMDAEEELIGTDINNQDTDGDGLNDKFELEAGLEPTKKDSDDNGTLDSDEDLDGDGLKNIEEQKYNTSAILEDTDGDGLNDYEELNNYNTNPLENDTDKDGINDGKEIELGIDPNKKDSNGNGINDGDEKYSVDIKTPESDKSENIDINIEGSVSGKSIDDLYIINMENAHEFINSDIPGYIAPPFRVGNNSEDAIENVNLKFTLDSKALKDHSGDEFAVYRYNKEKQILEVVSESKRLNYMKGKDDTFTVNNVLLGMEYYEYIVLNKTKWDEAWSKEILEPGNNSGMLDIVLTIDSSGSMYSNDPDNLRKQESIDFINKLDGENRAAVVDFDSRAKVIQDLTTDKKLLANAINEIDSNGGTNISDGLRKSIDVLDSNGSNKSKYNHEDYITNDEIVDDKGEVLKEIEDIDYIENIESLYNVKDITKESNEENRNKFIMLLTDGQSFVDTNLIEEAKSKSIKIYTIGLGSGVDSKLLENISKETNGKYQYGETSEDFEQIFKELSDETINLIQDSDKDGIPDYFEENMRLVGGIFIKLNPKEKDTDGDGINDGEEITGKKNPTAKDFHDIYLKEQKAFEYISRPDLEDTDGDGINDNEDEDIKNANVTPRLLLKASDLSYENTVDYINLDVKDIEFKERDLPTRGLDDIGEWRIIESDDPYGFGAVVLKKGNQIIIAYTGSADISEFFNPNWTADYIGQHLLSFLLKLSYQRDFATELLDSIVNKYGQGHYIYITGHSLGGYLAQVATYRLNYEIPKGQSIFKEAMTFNTEPILNNRMLHKDKDISLNKVESLGFIGNDRLVHNYHIGNDILHKYLITLLNRPIMGGSKRIFYSNYSPSKAHDLTNFYDKHLTFYNE